jgi:WD40 repeat protein
MSLGDSPVGWAILSLDGKRLLARHADRSACVWDLTSEKKLCSFSIEKITKAHNMTFAFSPDGRYACMGGIPGWVYLWRLPRP